MEEVLVPLIVFATVFGIVYLYFMTRNKERMALIEKGADASIFVQPGSKKHWSVQFTILNFALLFMGIGLGLIVAVFLEPIGGAVYPSMLFLFGGLGLLIGFFITRKMIKTDQEETEKENYESKELVH